MSIQRRPDELVDLLRPDFVGNDGTASPSFVWVCAGFGTAAAPGFRFCADPDTGLYRPAANELGIATLGTRRGIWNATGALILNDAAASSFMTGPGVTIQQGAYDDEAIAIESTDVTHGMTDFADTDTYFALRKAAGTAGGANFGGFKDADGVGGAAVRVDGYLGENADTTKTTAGRAIVEVRGRIKSGTGIGNTNADGNVFGVRTQRGGAAVTLLLVDEDGDCWELGDEYLSGSHRQSVSVGVRAYRDADFVHNHTGNWLPIDFNQQRWDDPDDNQWAIGTPTRLTAQIDGIYVISGCIAWASNVTGERRVAIRFNGGNHVAEQREQTVVAGWVVQSVSTTYKMVATDFVELMAFQNSGGNLNVNSAADYSPEFSMVRVA